MRVERHVDQTVIRNQQAQVTQAKTDAETAQDAKVENAFIDKFIQRYLLKKDAEANGTAMGSSGAKNGYVLSLFT